MTTVFQKTSCEKLAVIEPDKTHKRIADFPEVCITTFGRELVDELSSLPGAEKLVDLSSANGRYPVYKIEYKGVPIAAYMSMVGGPGCAMEMEEAIAYGARKFVVFGSCGILDDERATGKIIVPTHAIRDEGICYHYLPASEEIALEEESVRRLSDVLEKEGIPYIQGKTWTTDALYRETRERVNERKAQGCIAVDMECASLCAVAKFRNVPFVQYLYGADNLDASDWQRRDLNDHGVTKAELYCRIALECAIALYYA